MARPPRAAFIKRVRPERPPKTDPSAIPGEPHATPAENAAQDVETWEPISGEEMSDTLTGIFEGAAEGFGSEWELPPDRARKMGERWARILNRFAKRARNPLVLRMLVYLAIGFACIELGAVVASRVVRTMRRVREEKRQELLKRAALKVVPQDAPTAGAGGAP